MHVHASTHTHIYIYKYILVYLIVECIYLQMTLRFSKCYECQGEIHHYPGCIITVFEIGHTLYGKIRVN